MATCHSELSASLILHSPQGMLDDLLLELFDDELEASNSQHEVVDLCCPFHASGSTVGPEGYPLGRRKSFIERLLENLLVRLAQVVQSKRWPATLEQTVSASHLVYSRQPRSIAESDEKETSSALHCTYQTS